MPYHENYQGIARDTSWQVMHCLTLIKAPNKAFWSYLDTIWYIDEKHRWLMWKQTCAMIFFFVFYVKIGYCIHWWQLLRAQQEILTDMLRTIGHWAAERWQLFLLIPGYELVSRWVPAVAKVKRSMFYILFFR